MMILSTSISVSVRRSTADRSSTQCVAADDVFHSLFMLLGIALAVVSAVFHGLAVVFTFSCLYGLGVVVGSAAQGSLTMLRGYPESAMQFEHCQQNCRWTARSGSSPAPPSF